MVSYTNGSYYALSTDELPTDEFGETDVPNGAQCYIMDTKKVMVFDRENRMWREV